MGVKDCPPDPPGSDCPPVSPATYPPRLGSFLIQIRVHFKNQPAVEWLYFLLMILIGFISCSDELCYDCDTIAALSRGETEEIAPLILHWSSIGFWNWVIHNTSMKGKYILKILKYQAIQNKTVFRKIVKLHHSKPVTRTNYIVIQGCRPWECRGAMAPPDLGRSVNPISTRRGRLCPPHYYWHPWIFRLSYGPG